MKRRTKKKKVSRWTKIVHARQDLLQAATSLTSSEKKTLSRLTKKIAQAEKGW